MTSVEATTEVFWTAFQALPKAAREGFLARLISDPKLREDLLDRAAIAERRSEKTRPFSAYLAERSVGHAAR